MQALRNRITSSLFKASKSHSGGLSRSSLAWKPETLLRSSIVPARNMETAVQPASSSEQRTYVKTKKLTKTAAHIMQILNREAVAEVKNAKPIPELRPGDVVQLKVEVPDNKRRVSSFRGIVMAIRRSGIQSTFRIRRFLAGVGVELLFPMYSPNIKEMKVLEHRRVRRNKLYYMREKMQDKRNKIT